MAKTQLTVDAYTSALYHMDGVLASAEKKYNSEGTSSRDLTEYSTISSTNGIVVPTTDGAYQVHGASAGDRLEATFDCFGSTVFSLEFWIKTTETGDGAIIDNYGVASSYISLRAIPYFDFTGQVYLELSTDDYNYTSIMSTVPINDGNWHYVVITYDASGTDSAKIYVDGVPAWYNVFDFRPDTATGALSNNVLTGILDRVYGGSPFTSETEIDELRLSFSVRTPEEIYAYYNTDAPSSGRRRSSLVTI